VTVGAAADAVAEEVAAVKAAADVLAKIRSG
jgi:hypothetical protein